MSLFDLQANENWSKVPKNDVRRQLEQLREQYRSALRNYHPDAELEELRQRIEQCEKLLNS